MFIKVSTTKVEFEPEMVDNSSVISTCPSHYNKKRINCFACCLAVIPYLKDKPITERRLGHFIYCMKCDCNDPSKNNIKNTHPNYTKEYIKIIIAGSLPIKGPLSIESYKKHGLVGLISCGGLYDPDLMSNDSFIQDLANIDMVSSLEYNNKTVEIVIQRYKIIEKINKKIFSILFPSYFRYFKTVVKVSSLSSLPSKTIDKIAEYGLIKATCAERELNKMAKFMFIDISTSNDIVKKRVEEIKLNPHILVDFMTKFNDRILERFKHDCSVSLGRDDIVVVNDTDEIGDKVNDYFPIHIVRYCTMDGKVYQFTSPSFKYIINKGVNPYTREKLPQSIINKAKKFNPPEPMKKPLFMLINDIIHPKDISELVVDVLARHKKKSEDILRFLNTMIGVAVTPLGTRIPEEFVPNISNPITLFPEIDDSVTILIYRNRSRPETRYINMKLWIPGDADIDIRAIDMSEEEIISYIRNLRARVRLGESISNNDLEMYVKCMSFIAYINKDIIESITV